ncbi:hypothetical protein [Sphingomonas aracearum]|uniref:Uncharacterized protein n=1 Tax=Sphingomonas aracearum TaxID=2283317 RepID=A0A369VZI0_9SPHN|nr:hypothetical protein [Sphingomonas aracearum]RDE05231.1 hypothetical protein DVW87_08135 [Sphingomonas aracearum]
MLTLALLTLASLASDPAATPLEHSSRADHPSGVAHARYRGDLAIEHRQVGSAAPGGRMSTLSCRWSARLTVRREARHATGAALHRSFERAEVLEGRRPGWCDTQRAAIRQEVAQRSGELRGHLVSLAAEDSAVLHAELDRLHEASRTG